MVVLVLSILVVAMMTVSVGAVSAKSSDGPSLKHIKPGNGGYVVTIGNSVYSGQGLAVQPMSLSNTISQGRTQWAQKTISGYYTSIGADLYWGNPSNSLRMRIYTPDGYVLGPFYDNFDGLLNGDIPVLISRSSGVSQGTYYYEIYGDRVSGWQYYTFT
jgi:hypothetical protein